MLAAEREREGGSKGGKREEEEGRRGWRVRVVTRGCWDGRSIQRDILEQVLFVSSGADRERYIAIARKLAAASDGDLEVIG